MSVSDTYRTIEKPSKGVYRDRGSRFLAFAFPVFSTEEIESTLMDLRKEYHDARHHCYAYRLGAEKKIFRANDDGEPSSSAGKPILGQIQSHNLSNILIVVVRYFGGTKLGVGGLINAYRSAAADSLQNAIITEGEENDLLVIYYQYSLTNDIMKIVNEENMKIQEQEFTDVCRLEILIRKSRSKFVIERVNKLQGAVAEHPEPSA